MSSTQHNTVFKLVSIMLLLIVICNASNPHGEEYQLAKLNIVEPKLPNPLVTKD